MMATVSSHALNGVDGSHADGIGVRLVNLSTGTTVFDAATDGGGRLTREVDSPDLTARYELIFQTGAYWQGRARNAHGVRIIEEIAVRFTMPDPHGRYHIPLILSPHSYSLWGSTEHG